MVNSSLNNAIMGKVNIEDRGINEKLLFNTALLNECKIFSPRIEIDLNKYGGALYHKELGLIDIETVHPVGEPLYNQKTTDCDYPKGLQIRSNMITDASVVESFQSIIESKRWDVRRDQIVLIRLPKEYQYDCAKTGKKIVWGVLDGNHRVSASSKQNQERLIAWTVEMPLKKIRKYANAVLNNDTNVVKGREDIDILESFRADLNDSESTLHKQTIEARESGNEKEVKKIWTMELDDYNLHANKRNALLNRLLISQTEYYKGNRPWTKDAMELYITDKENTFTKGWTEVPSTKRPEDYITPTNVKVVRFFDTGNDLLSAAWRYVQIKNEDPDSKVLIIFAIKNGKDISTENLLIEERKKVHTKFWNILTTIYNVYQKLETGDISYPTWKGYPQNDAELKGKGFISMVV